MKKIIKITCLLLLTYGSSLAQEKKAKQFNTKKWYRNFGIGNSSYRYIGIPKGRNEINYRGSGKSVDQSKGGGLVLDAKIQYKFTKNYIGININYYSDRKNSSGSRDQTINRINSDRLTELTIYDNQSYVNFGFHYERQLYDMLQGRVSFNASFGIGYSANLTPDRLEYDYYYKDFLTPSADTSAALRHVSTDFRDGGYINPAIKIKINSSTNHGMIIELSYLYQWNKAHKNYINKVGALQNYSQDYTSDYKYKVHAIQLKFNYFF